MDVQRRQGETTMRKTNDRPTRRGIQRDGGACGRLVEQILTAGENGLTDSELLSLILGWKAGSNGHESPDRILSRVGGMRSLASKSGTEMLTFRGIGRFQAARLAAVFALVSRLCGMRLHPGVRLRSSRDVFEHFHLRSRDLKKENFWILLLDSKNRMIREERVSEGSLTAAIVHPREVFRSAIAESARAILAVHNHPSGDPTPSREDFEITLRLKQVGELVGIELLDHVILGDGEFLSLREHKLVEW